MGFLTIHSDHVPPARSARSDYDVNVCLLDSGGSAFDGIPSRFGILEASGLPSLVNHDGGVHRHGASFPTWQ